MQQQHNILHRKNMRCWYVCHYFFSRLHNYVSVPCFANKDCDGQANKTICKQTERRGSKTCQLTTSCSESCSPDHFCDVDNTCQEMKVNECATTGDCDLLGTNKTICKLYLVGNLQKCVTPNLCQQRCKDKQVCGLDGRCVNQGRTDKTKKKIYIYF